MTIDQVRAQYGTGGACDATPQNRTQCDAACKSGLSAVKQAFPQIGACSGSSPSMNGPSMNAGGGGAGPCKAYLSCILGSSPSTYAAALAVYGEEAPCWDNPMQSAGCDAACTKALSGLTDVCSCSGSTCTAYPTLSSGNYAFNVAMLSSDVTCSVYKMTSLKPAVLTRYSNTSYRLTPNLTVTQTNPWGGNPEEYTIFLEAMIAIQGTQGTAKWNGETQQSTGAVKITGEDAFQADLDRYADGTCLYRISFTKL